MSFVRAVRARFPTSKLPFCCAAPSSKNRPWEPTGPSGWPLKPMGCRSRPYTGSFNYLRLGTIADIAGAPRTLQPGGKLSF